MIDDQIKELTDTILETIDRHPVYSMTLFNLAGQPFVGPARYAYYITQNNEKVSNIAFTTLALRSWIIKSSLEIGLWQLYIDGKRIPESIVSKIPDAVKKEIGDKMGAKYANGRKHRHEQAQIANLNMALRRCLDKGNHR